MKLSELIHRYRKENRLTMEQLSKKTDIILPYISKLENEFVTMKDGSKVTPSLKILAKLAKGMGLEIDALIEMCDDLKQYSSKNKNIATPPEFLQLVLPSRIFFTAWWQSRFGCTCSCKVSIKKIVCL